MADNFRFAQLQPYSLAGSGAVIGDTSITLKSMTDIDGNALTMASTFGTSGFGTLEPGNGTLEEQITFTGLTNNTNGSVTLTGVSNVSFVYPYTQTSGLLKTHAGSTIFIISNTAGFYDKLTSKSDDETIAGTWTFTNPNYPQMDAATPLPTGNAQLATKAYVDSVVTGGAADANTTTKGLVQIATQAQVDAKTITGSTSAYLVQSLNTQRSTLLSDYIVDTGSPNVIVITPSPAVSSYSAGQQFSFKVTNTNTSPTVSINVNGLGAKSLVKLNGSTSPVAGDLASGQVIAVEYDGTNFQLVSPSALNPVIDTTAQTVAGVKTFTSIPVLPASDPTTANQATRKSYVDGRSGYGGITGGSGAQVSVAQVSSTDTTVRSLSIPIMGANDLLVIYFELFNSGTNTFKLKSGSSTFYTSAGISNSHTRFSVYILNRNATGSQVIWGSYNTATDISTTAAVDTSAAFTLDVVSNGANTNNNTSEYATAILYKA